MNATTNRLIENLQTLRNNQDNNNIFLTAGLALAALAGIKDYESKTDLKGLIGNTLNNFDPITGMNPLNKEQLNNAVKIWFTQDLIDEDKMKTITNSESNDKNLLNQIGIMISSCVEGKLSEDICKNSIPELKDMNIQNVNVTLAIHTLSVLGFRKKDNKLESVDEWKKDLPENLSEKLNPKLEEILNIFVETINSVGDIDSTPIDTTKLIPVNLNKNQEQKQENMSAIILAINSEMDSMSWFQKYNASLLPIKAKNLGLINMDGGAGLISYDKDESGTPTSMRYNSYVDEQIDTRKNFYTADVLTKYFDKLSSSLEKNKIKIEPDEIKTIKEQLTKLGEDEKKIANLSSTIEKYLALHKYWGADGKNDVPKADSVENIQKLLDTHKEKFERVEKKRKGLGNILYVLAQRVDSIIY